MSAREKVRQRMQLLGIEPKKSLGQNFLIDEIALTDIAHAISISGKKIIEV
jgi:16S rRNA A1518/A1519 N6-dimethyltransferase RsmA/KsgA/DIM1 with predicted DNA glycosylase/AP lyase activity